MRCATRLLPFVAFPVVLTLGAEPALAQSAREQLRERRIEEEKRDDLKPTTPQAAEPSPVAALPPSAIRPPAPNSQALESIFLATLAQKRVAYRHDAMLGLLMALGLDQKYINLDSQIAFFEREGLVPPSRRPFDPMQPLRRGVLAYMIREALDIPGGITLTLFGPSERYAMKELEFQGLMSPGLADDLISGDELLQSLAQVTTYRATRMRRAKQ